MNYLGWGLLLGLNCLFTLVGLLGPLIEPDDDLVETRRFWRAMARDRACIWAEIREEFYLKQAA